MLKSIKNKRCEQKKRNVKGTGEDGRKKVPRKKRGDYFLNAIDFFFVLSFIRVGFFMKSIIFLCCFSPTTHSPPFVLPIYSIPSHHHLTPISSSLLTLFFLILAAFFSTSRHSHTLTPFHLINKLPHALFKLISFQ